MKEIFYKIGEVSEMLGIEQHTLRYLENTLKLRIKRDERGDRLYTEKDIETLRLVMQLKEKGLNTTAIRMALDNVEEVGTAEETALQPKARASMELKEIMSITIKIMEQIKLCWNKNKKWKRSWINWRKKLINATRKRKKLSKNSLPFGKLNRGKSRSWISRLRGK